MTGGFTVKGAVGSLFVLFLAAFCSPAAPVITNAVPLILNPERIMRLTMDHSARIEAAKYNLKSAEYNFKLFESRYTKFSPFVMRSELSRDEDHEYESGVRTGVEKDFFDGSSISSGVGAYNTWGENSDEENGQYLYARVNMPLFSSNRKLTRLIERTFEENELYSAQLDYVDDVRDTIKEALEQYYDFIPRSQALEKLRSYKDELVGLKDSDPLKHRDSDRELLDGEVNSLTSRIQGREISVQSLQIEMERWIGVDNFDDYSIELIQLAFDEPDHFGEFYVMAPVEEILKQTMKNDTELMVLELIKTNAQEKKKLAEQGKWDIFLSVEGRYNLNEEVAGASEGNSYSIGTGLTIKRFDRSVLLNTIRKADADISYIDETIKDRRREMASEITRKKMTLLTTRDQVLSSRKTLDSRQKIHSRKKEDFLNGQETADNYVQSFRSLTEAMLDSLHYENEYLDEIRDLDYICGVYFQFLGINAYEALHY